MNELHTRTSRSTSHFAFIGFVVMATAALAACSTRPLPQSAQAGSTIVIPVKPDDLDVGYGGKDYTDHQRGEIVYVLDGPGGFELETRFSVGAAAHPASVFGSGPTSWPWVYPVEVISIVDIPPDAPEGTHALYTLLRRAGQPDVPGPEYHGEIQILPPSITVEGGEEIVGAPTPLEGWLCGSGCGFDDFYEFERIIPRPQLRVSVNGGGGGLLTAAFELVLSYPANVIDVIDALEEPAALTPMKDSALVWIDDDDAGTVSIRGVVPPGRTYFGTVDVVFELVDGAAQILDPATVQVASVTAYDYDGNALPGAAATVIGIK